MHLQGDIVAILDSDGTAVVQYKYDAWGRQIGCDVEAGNSNATALSTLNPFRYRGYVYDEETELYYLRSRYYDSYMCRFSNADGILSNNLFCYCLNAPVIAKDPAGYEYQVVLDKMFSPLDWYYIPMDSSRDGINTLNSKMSSEEFCVHLWRAHNDEKWKYTYGHAQYQDTDCVGLYKAIMEWYYCGDAFDSLTEITPGGEKFNQVKDLISYGIELGEDGLNPVCSCCDLPPVGAAVFCYKTKEDGNRKFNGNRGWTHVGYYVGNGIVIEAEGAQTGVSSSSIFDPKWDCWGYLRGIDY